MSSADRARPPVGPTLRGPLRAGSIPLLVCVNFALTTPALPAQAAALSHADSMYLDAIFAPFARTDGPGCAVGVSTGGVLRFAKGYGMASVEHQIPIGARTPFNIGSIGKQFTAMATLLLEQRGALSLDDPVSTYYGGLPTAGTPLRIRDLLYHTSGLRDYGALGMLAGNFATTRDGFDALMRRQRGLNFPTGTQHEYSHSDYTVLAEVIARASGMPFADFLEREIFVPLGMRSTRVLDGRRRPVPGIATTYARDGAGLRARYPSGELIGGNNLFTSVEDLLRWDANAISGAVGGRALVDRLHRLAPLTLSYVMPYSHGLWFGEYRGERLEHRSGGGGGYRTTYLRFPDAGLTITALCNDADADPFPFAQRVADDFLADRPAATDPAADSIPTPPGEAARLAGRYASTQTPWSPFEFVEHAGELFERFNDDSSRLTRLRDGRFAADGMLYRFTPGPNGGAMQLLLTGDDIREEGVRVPRVPAWRPTRQERDGYVGRWLSDELAIAWSTAIEQNQVVLHRPGADEVVLEPIARDWFRGSVKNGAGYPTWISLTFARDRQGAISGFSVSTIPAAFEVARGVRFVRIH